MSDPSEIGAPDESIDQRPPDKRHVFDNPRNVKRVIYTLFTVCGLLLAVDLLDITGVLYHKHIHFAFERWFGFFAFFGFLLSVALVLTAKEMRKLLKRDEDYYDR